MKSLKYLLYIFISFLFVANFVSGCSETVKPSDDNDSTTTSGNCPTGYVFNEANNGCDIVPTCGTGYSLDTSTNTCIANTPTCATGYILDTATNTCVSTGVDTPTCETGYSLDTSTNTCIADTPTCATGYVLDTSTNTCIIETPTCDSGYILDEENNICIKNITDCGGQNEITDTDTGISTTYTCNQKYAVNQYIEIYNSNCEQTEEPDLCGYYEVIADSIDAPPTFPSISDECENIAFCVNE